jgi:poly-gamma-glutamate capsule biosynthesis protein CapA/YwtB (metallophosphatase superfamily)
MPLSRPASTVTLSVNLEAPSVPARRAARISALASTAPQHHLDSTQLAGQPGKLLINQFTELPYPCDAELREDYVKLATDYVRLAEAVNGPIPQPVPFSYVWGAALNEFGRMRPDVRIVNLETSITLSDTFAAKGINYRMSPENTACLTTAAIDCCTLANNHVLDFGHEGLLDTLLALDRLHIKTAGAGRKEAEAGAPAIVDVAGGARVLVWSFASTTSGVPRSRAATQGRAGVNLLPNLSEANVATICEKIARLRRGSRAAQAVRACPGRPSRRIHRPRAFVAPCQSHRSLSRSHRALRLRRFPERL